MNDIMKRFFALGFLFVSLSVFAQGYSELYEGEAASGMRAHVEALCAENMAGRGAGTEGEAAAAEYISRCFKDAGIDSFISAKDCCFGLLQDSGDTLVSHNVIGIIPGYDKDLKEHYIVIGARLDNIGKRTVTVNGESKEMVYPGANGNASGLAILIQLAKKLQTNKVLLKRSVIIAAFGASITDNAGSWYFLNRSFEFTDKIDAMINLDMLGTGSRGFYAYTASNADMDNVINSLANTLQPVQPKIVTHEPVRSDHRSFYAKEIPSVFFTSGMYPEYNSVSDLPSTLDYEDMDRECEYIYNFSVALANGAAPSFTPDNSKSKASDDVVPYYDCDTKPTFFRSSDPRAFLSRWVYVYMKYPEYAVENGIQGKVLVYFVIDEKGKVGDVSVIKGVHPSLDQEAVRVISASPDWKPAKVNGKKVKSSMSLYVEFRLQKK